MQKLTRSLVGRGWQEKQDRGPEEPGFDLERSGDIVFSLNLNPAVGGTRVSFSPTIGAGHLEVGRLSSLFKGRRPRSAGALGVAAGLSGLLNADGVPDAFARWRIKSIDEVDAVTDVLVQDLDSYGWRFLEQFTDLRDLISWLQTDRGTQMINGTLAIACALDGRESDAVVAISDFAEFATTQIGPLREQTVHYVQQFVTHFGIGAEVLQRLLTP